MEFNLAVPNWALCGQW